MELPFLMLSVVFSSLRTGSGLVRVMARLCTRGAIPSLAAQAKGYLPSSQKLEINRMIAIL